MARVRGVHIMKDGKEPKAMSSMPVKCTVAADRARLLNPRSIMPRA